jgi:hypothetical protein
MTDEARAVAEVAKTTGEAIRAASGAGGYLADVFGSVPHSLVGVLGGDWLHEKRRRNLAQLQANTDRLLDAIAAERRTEISGSVFLSLIEACADEGRPELQALWAALLANAMVDGGRKVRRDFFDAVRRMEPADARIFDAMSKFVVVDDLARDQDRKMNDLRRLAKEAGGSDVEVDVSVEALAAMNCFRMDRFRRPMLTPFGSALLAACRPPT